MSLQRAAKAASSVRSVGVVVHRRAPAVPGDATVLQIGDMGDKRRGAVSPPGVKGDACLDDDSASGAEEPGPVECDAAAAEARSACRSCLAG